MASWHLAESRHFSPITKHSFSDCWTFFSGRRTFFGCVWCHLNCGGQSTTQWLRWWSLLSKAFEALFWSPRVFFQIMVKQHFASALDLFHVVNVSFSWVWKYTNSYPSLNIFCKNDFMKSKICKTLCKFNWKGFRINLQITHVKPCGSGRLQLKRSPVKFSGFIKEPPISGNFCGNQGSGQGLK